MAQTTHSVLEEVRVAVEERLRKHNTSPDTFLQRFDRYAPDCHQLLFELYGERKNFEIKLERIFLTAVDSYCARPQELKDLDRVREQSPRWYQKHTMVGGVCYVDLFAGSLQGISEKLDYFDELGLTYLHLMPLFRTPQGPDDGGYAVSSYREVDPEIGTMEDLRKLAHDLCQQGINLVLDLVFNHTANDHEWALKARSGNPVYQSFYFMFEDREQPDAYEKTLREIFPEEHPGAFTYYPDMEKWVWTTFHAYQWDLNYRNPDVFRHILEEMLFLANVGVDVLRLDAVPFIWKEMGTPCENLPQAHTIIRAFNTLVRIAAPGMIFKSEAIVHPDDVVSYLGTGAWAGRECELSYNPLLMVELWESLATGHTHMLTYAMRERFTIPENACWVNYVRSHDDIGWGFANEDAKALGIHPFYHRQFLNRFYTGEAEGSFAKGLPFQYNPETEDMRISGTTASLAGLEQALAADDESGINLALNRIAMMYGIIMSMGGIPLIYLGDEIAMLNDYSYREDPRTAHDSRWVHRPEMDWNKAARRHNDGTIEARIFRRMQRLIAVRKQRPEFGMRAATKILSTGNSHIFAVIKALDGERLLLLANFSPEEQTVRLDAQRFGTQGHCLLHKRAVDLSAPLKMAPYDLLWVALKSVGEESMH